MPILPPSNTGVYDTWTTICNAARMRLRSRMPSLQAYSGNILDATQAETQQAASNALRRLQDGMVDAGSPRFSKETVIFGIPPVTNSDPASQQSMSWTEFFDGTNYQTTPVLPSDLILPLWMSERRNGSGLPFPPPNLPNMNPLPDGIPKRTKAIFNGCWQWRDDHVVFPGATQSVDFWIYYRSFLPDPVDVGSVRWFNSTVNIARCQDPLVWWLCREFAIARLAEMNSADAASPLGMQMTGLAELCETQAAEATKKLVNRDQMAKQRMDVRRIPYGGGGSTGRGRGGCW